MLTVAYCRVSTEEQAAEGFSIDGQADKLIAYAELHDLGEVTVVEDAGASGKNLERPGLQQVLSMIDRGHVEHLLVWRLDRLSRNLGDLILLADTFGKADVALHSFTERLDLSSATGRMFYNVLGSFAQFYREQLAENVVMGMSRAAREGKWTNRPKTGYDLIDGELVPNADAELVRRIFRLRAEGSSMKEIERLTGVNYSTARGIVESRVYVGEVVWRGEWFRGNHEAVITEQEWERAQRGWVKDRRRQSSHPLSGVVRCGLCGRSASVDGNGKGSRFYRCIHRGQGCDQSRRSVNGVERAALLGLRLVGQDEALQEAIRLELRRVAGGVPVRGPRAPALIEDLRKRRRRLLDLHYADKISADLFAEQEAEVTAQIASLEGSMREEQQRREERNSVAQAFEDVARHLSDLDIDEIWGEANDKEKWVIASDLLDEISIHPDHLEVKVAGAPRLNVTLREVGLTGGSTFYGVGEAFRLRTTREAALAVSFKV
ncbi:MAG TPA: recombinase family protein [Acidimicrobiia bacterium]|nr:recombinase family protein [Acidimicrobiia bacterium]